MYATVGTSSSTWPGAVRTLASFSATWKPSPPPSPIPGPPIQYNQPPEQVPRTAAHSLVFCARGEKTQCPVAGRMSQLLLEKEEKARAWLLVSIVCVWHATPPTRTSRAALHAATWGLALISTAHRKAPVVSHSTWTWSLSADRATRACWPGRNNQRKIDGRGQLTRLLVSAVEWRTRSGEVLSVVTDFFWGGINTSVAVSS
jgi:hypothetical protein